MSFARIWNLNDTTAVWTTGGTNAKPRIEFTATDPDTGDSVASLIIRFYNAAAGTKDDASRVYISTLTPAQIAVGYHDASYGMKNKDQANSTCWLTLEAIDASGESSGESARTAFNVCWGQAMYEQAIGATASGWDFSHPNLPTNTEGAFLFRSATGASGAGPGAWQTDISNVTPAAYVNILVRLSTYTAGTNATLDDMTASWVGAGSATIPDKWLTDDNTKWSIDSGAYRYGTKALRFTVASNSAQRFCYPYRQTAGDDIVVKPNTDYTLSAFAKTNGPLGAGSLMHLIVYRGGGYTTLLTQGSAGPDQYDEGPGSTSNSGADPRANDGWLRLHVHFRTDASTTSVRVLGRYSNGGSGINDSGWWDAFRLEEGKVASPWSPSFISQAMVIDAYGLFIDGMSGATLRIRNAAGVIRDIEDIVAGVTYGPTTPAVQPYGGPATPGVSPNSAHADHEHAAFIRQQNAAGGGGRLALESGYAGGSTVSMDLSGASAAAETLRLYKAGGAVFAQFRTDDTKSTVQKPVGASTGIDGTSDFFSPSDHKHFLGLPFFDVRNYGAVGGGANDTTACQNALDAAETAGGGTVFFPFMCSLSAFLTVASNVRVLGAGWNAGLTPLASFTTPTYLMVNKNYATAVMNDHDIIVENMVFDYTPATTSSGGWHALEIRWARRIRVRNCRFVMDACGDAIAGLHVDDFVVDGCTALDFRNCAWDFWTDPTDVTVTNCWAETSLTNQMFNFNPEGSPGNDGTAAIGFTLTNCTFSYTGTGSIGSVVGPLRTGTQYGRDILIANNRFINCFITCRGATRSVVISGNTFQSVDGAAPVLSTVWNSQTPDGIVVMGNHVRACVNGTNGWIRIEGVNAIAMGNAGVGGDNSVPLVYYGSGSPVLIGNNSDLDTALRHRLNDRLSISSAITTHDDLDVSNTGSNGVSIKLTGDGATTPSKWIRVKAGILDILNSAFTIVVATLTDAGTFSVRGRVMPGDVAFGIQATGGMWHATGVPANANGNNNDWCISDNGHLYFRTAGAWVQKI